MGSDLFVTILGYGDLIAAFAFSALVVVALLRCD
jgi:hypothetical protein